MKEVSKRSKATQAVLLELLPNTVRRLYQNTTLAESNIRRQLKMMRDRGVVTILSIEDDPKGGRCAVYGRAQVLPPSPFELLTPVFNHWAKNGGKRRRHVPPKIHAENAPIIDSMHAQHATLRHIAEVVGVHNATILRYLNAQKLRNLK